MSWVKWLVMRPVFWLALILVFTLPAFFEHLALATDERRFDGDVAQHIAPYVIERETGLADEDYISSYYRASHPVGFRLLYDGFSKIGDPRILSKVLPYFLLAGFIAACGWGAYALCGSVGVLVVLTAALSSEVFLARMLGGSPRAFAFPVIALGVSAVIGCKPRVLATSVLLGAAFYPAVGVGLGSALAALQLLPLHWIRQEETPLSHRLTMVGVTSVVALLLVLPSRVAADRYGPVLASGDTDQSRLEPEDRFDFSQALPVYFVTSFAEVIAGLDPGKGKGILTKPHRWNMRKNTAGDRARLHAIAAVLSVVCGIGCAIAARRRTEVRRLWVVVACVAAVYGFAVVASPLLFLPQRHIAYALPVIALFAFIVGGGALLQVLVSRMKREVGLSVAIFCGIVLVFTASPLRPDRGLKLRVADEDVGWIQYLADTDRDAIVAGELQEMDPVAYTTGRRVLANWETNLPYHAGYVEEIETRKALVDLAINEQDRDAWRILVSDYGVTHLVIDRLNSEHAFPQGATVRVFGKTSVVTLPR